MFIGHFAAGFAAKKLHPGPSLATYFLAAQFLDLLWPSLLLLNLEHVELATQPATLPLIFTSYPISHSLVMVVLWSALFCLAYWAFKKDGKAALVLGICVLSHWFLDLVVHVPDLPVYPGDSPVFGWGLWKLRYASLIVESLIFVSGVYLYTSATRALNKTGSVAAWSLILFLFAIHLANVFGPPPTSINAVAWAGHLQWLFVLWAWWIDRNRRVSNEIPVHSTETTFHHNVVRRN